MSDPDDKDDREDGEVDGGAEETPQQPDNQTLLRLLDQNEKVRLYNEIQYSTVVCYLSFSLYISRHK